MFPKTANDIYRMAARNDLQNFELAKARQCVFIVTDTGVKQVFGHYYTHSYAFWMDAIREAFANNNNTPNIT